MKKYLFSALFFASTALAVFISLSLLLIIVWIIKTGATYSIQEGDSLICGIPLFTSENWLWVSFEVFVVPILVLIAAIATALRCYRLRV